MCVSGEFDVAVVGAGPGGSVAARFASEHGLKVILLEKNRKPRLKLCAGGLPREVMRDFDVDEEAIECVVRKLLYYTRKTGWYSVSARGTVTTYRTAIENEDFRRLDYQLAMRAEEQGAKLTSSAEVKGMVVDDHKARLLVKTPSGDRIITSKLVIGADGFNSIIAKSANLWKPYKRDEMAVAVQQEVLIGKNNENENCYHIFDQKIAKAGYLWIYPKSKGFTIGLGCVASHIVKPLKFVLEQVIKTNLFIKKILPSGSKFFPIEGAPIPVEPLKKIYANNVMLVGDAARHANPMTWGGVYNAMIDAKIASSVAAEAISMGDYSEQTLKIYQKKWYERLGKHLIWEGEKLRRVSENFVRHFELSISLLKNPYTACLANITNRTLPRVAKFIPPMLLDNLIM